MPKIFVSYRRSDSADIAARIADNLLRHYGEKNVFFDVRPGVIAPGRDFRVVLQESVNDAEVVLVVIGPDWADVREGDNPDMRRLDNENDFVRIEVEAALNNPDSVVIPVLVNNNPAPPSAGELPKSLEKIAFLQVSKVRKGGDFYNDFDSLVEAIDNAYAAKKRESRGRLGTLTGTSRTASSGGNSLLMPIIGVILLLLIAGGAFVALSGGGGDDDSGDSASNGETSEVADATEEATEDPTEAPTATDEPTEAPTDEPTPTEEPTATASPEPTEVADLSVPQEGEPFQLVNAIRVDEFADIPPEDTENPYTPLSLQCSEADDLARVVPATSTIVIDSPWATVTEAEAEDFFLHSQYSFTLNGEDFTPLAARVRITELDDAGDYTVAAWFSAVLGVLDPGDYTIETTLSFTGEHNDGLNLFSPDSGLITATCQFSVLEAQVGSPDSTGEDELDNSYLVNSVWLFGQTVDLETPRIIFGENGVLEDAGSFVSWSTEGDVFLITDEDGTEYTFDYSVQPDENRLILFGGSQATVRNYILSLDFEATSAMTPASDSATDDTTTASAEAPLFSELDRASEAITELAPNETLLVPWCDDEDGMGGQSFSQNETLVFNFWAIDTSDEFLENVRVTLEIDGEVVMADFPIPSRFRDDVDFDWVVGYDLETVAPGEYIVTYKETVASDIELDGTQYASGDTFYEGTCTFSVTAGSGGSSGTSDASANGSADELFEIGSAYAEGNRLNDDKICAADRLSDSEIEVLQGISEELGERIIYDCVETAPNRFTCTWFGFESSTDLSDLVPPGDWVYADGQYCLADD